VLDVFVVTYVIAINSVCVEMHFPPLL